MKKPRPVDWRQLLFVSSFAIAPLYLVGAVGCGDLPITPQAGDSRVEESVSADSHGDTLSSEVSLSVADAAEYNKKLTENKGSVVLVDFWATWCGPCVEQFSHTVKLHKTHREKGLSVISVSMDEPDSHQDVLAFLKSKGAECTNLISPYGASEEFANHFDLRGDLPFYKLYDRNGQLRYTFSENPGSLPNCEPVENIDKRVEELLAAPGT